MKLGDPIVKNAHATPRRRPGVCTLSLRAATAISLGSPISAASTSARFVVFDREDGRDLTEDDQAQGPRRRAAWTPRAPAPWTPHSLHQTRNGTGLADTEHLWCPVADAWTIGPDPDRAGRWTYECDFAPTPPAPITSISWRIVHLIADNEIHWEYAFCPGERTFPDLEVPHAARRALDPWRAQPQACDEVAPDSD